MKSHDVRLFPGAIAAMVACDAVGSGVTPVVVCGLGIALAVVAIGVTWLTRSRGGIHDVAVATALAAALSAALAGGAAWQLDLRLSEQARATVMAEGTAQVSGVVAIPPTPAEPDAFTGQPRWRMTVSAHSLDGSPAKARVVVFSAQDDAVLGQHVVVTGRLYPASSPREAAVMWDGLAIPAEGSWGEPGREPSFISSAVTRIREEARAASATVHPAVQDLTLGMAIGDDSRMAVPQMDAMRRSGLAHLTAVSGAHFSIVIVTVLWVLRTTRLHRAVQAAVLGAAAIGFTALVLAQPAVLRALTAAIVIVLGIAWGRPARAVAALSAGVLVLLALDPFLASALGFQLSVVAVAALALWAPHLAFVLQRWCTPWLARALSIPVAASAVTAPLLLAAFGGVGLYTVPANLLATLFAAPVTLVGLAAAVVGPVAPGMATILWHMAGWAAWPVAWVAAAFSSVPGGWWEPRSGWAAAGVAMAVVFAVAATNSARIRGWGRLAAVMGAVVAASASPVLTVWTTPRMSDWNVVACDVGQGDAMLLRSGPTSAVMIDVGSADQGAVECLSRYGVRRIELLVITHPHEDHDGAVRDVLSAVPVEQAWVSSASAQSHSTQVLHAAGIPVEKATRGVTATVGSVHLRVLGPPPDSRHWGENDASVVVFAQVGGGTVLALGDLEHEGQRAVADILGAPVIVDVVKVAHHGSAVQDEGLARLITARIAIMSVGGDNPYGHPSPGAVALYGARSAMVQRTDKCGDILVGFADGVKVASRCPPPVAG